MTVQYKQSSLWTYEWDTDYHGGWDNYDDTFENASRCNVGHVITELESTIFIGQKACLVKFMELEGFDTEVILDEINPLYYDNE